MPKNRRRRNRRGIARSRRAKPAIALAEVVIEEDLSRKRATPRKTVSNNASASTRGLAVRRKPPSWSRSRKGKPTPEKQRAYDEDMDKAARALCPAPSSPASGIWSAKATREKAPGLSTLVPSSRAQSPAALFVNWPTKATCRASRKRSWPSRFVTRPAAPAPSFFRRCDS